MGKSKCAAGVQAAREQRRRREVVYILPAHVYIHIPIEDGDDRNTIAAMENNVRKAVAAVTDAVSRTAGVIDVSSVFPKASCVRVELEGIESIFEDGGEGLLSLLQPHMIIRRPS